MSEPKPEPQHTPPGDHNLLSLLNRNGINTVVLVCAIGGLFVGYNDVADLKQWKRDHEQKGDARREQVDRTLQSVTQEAAIARERHASILAAMARMEKQLEQSTVVVKAGGQAR